MKKFLNLRITWSFVLFLLFFLQIGTIVFGQEPNKSEESGSSEESSEESNENPISPFLVQFLIDSQCTDMIKERQFQELIWMLNFMKKNLSLESNRQLLEKLIRQYHNTVGLVLKYPLDKGRVEMSESGVTGARFVELAPEMRGVFKTEDGGLGANIASEVAAFRLDLLLGLNIVPHTVKMSFQGEWGSMQYMVQGKAETFVPMDKASPHLKKLVMAGEEYQNLKFLDFLMENYDRHEGNFLVGTKTGKIVAIDNGWGFPGTRAIKRWPHLMVMEAINFTRDPEMALANVLPGKEVRKRLMSLSEGEVRKALNIIKKSNPEEGEEIVRKVLVRLATIKAFLLNLKVESEGI